MADTENQPQASTASDCSLSSLLTETVNLAKEKIKIKQEAEKLTKKFSNFAPAKLTNCDCDLLLRVTNELKALPPGSTQVYAKFSQILTELQKAESHFSEQQINGVPAHASTNNDVSLANGEGCSTTSSGALDGTKRDRVRKRKLSQAMSKAEAHMRKLQKNLEDMKNEEVDFAEVDEKYLNAMVQLEQRQMVVDKRLRSAYKTLNIDISTDASPQVASSSMSTLNDSITENPAIDKRIWDFVNVPVMYEGKVLHPYTVPSFSEIEFFIREECKAQPDLKIEDSEIKDLAVPAYEKVMKCLRKHRFYELETDLGVDSVGDLPELTAQQCGETPEALKAKLDAENLKMQSKLMEACPDLLEGDWDTEAHESDQEEYEEREVSESESALEESEGATREDDEGSDLLAKVRNIVSGALGGGGEADDEGTEETSSAAYDDDASSVHLIDSEDEHSQDAIDRGQQDGDTGSDKDEAEGSDSTLNGNLDDTDDSTINNVLDSTESSPSEPDSASNTGVIDESSDAAVDEPEVIVLD